MAADRAVFARHSRRHGGDGRDRRRGGDHRHPARPRAGDPARVPHPAAQRVDRHLRRHAPRAAAARAGAARLFRAAQCRHQPAFLRRALARALLRARRFCRGDFLGRHPLDPQGPMGSGALDRNRLCQHAGLHRAAPGCAADRCSPHQPHARDRQEHRARDGDRRFRDPQPGDDRAVLRRQRDAADDGGDRLCDPLHSRRRAGPLAGDAVRLAEGLMQALLQQFFDFAIMARALPLLLTGLGQTLVLCLVVIPLGLIGGLLVALTSLARWRAAAAIDFFRAIPPLVLLIFVYAGLPFAGIRLSPLAAVAIAFLLNNSSYYGEIYRAGIESVGRGQWDAARSTGLKAYQALLHVVLPQAVRNVLPDLISNTVEVVKLTSLASVVALPELLYSADMARSITFNTSPIVLAAAIYLVMLWPVVRLVSRMERRIAT